MASTKFWLWLDAIKKYYRKGEGLTGKVWERNEPLLTINSKEEPGYIGKSAEITNTSGIHGIVIVPFVDFKGKVMGIIRCSKKKSTQNFTMPNMFNDDDVAILDSIGQSLVPHLHVLLEEDRRAKALGKLTPTNFRTTIDNENNSPSYLPLSTVNHINNKRVKLSIKKVNVI